MRGNRNTNTSAQWGAHVTDRRGRQHEELQARYISVFEQTVDRTGNLSPLSAGSSC